MKRILSCRTSDFQQCPAPEAFIKAIRDSEGRVIMAEFDANTSPYYPEISNAEILAAYGADLILIKSLNCETLHVAGAGEQFGKEGISQVRKLVGLPTGVSLQVVPKEQYSMSNAFTVEHLMAVKHADFLCLTAYDKPGITADMLIEAISLARKHYDGLIIAAKYFASGVDEPETYAQFAKANAHAVVVAAPGSVRRSSEERVEKAIAAIQAEGALAITTISSSQEGSDIDTVRNIALASKRCGSDMANFGDAGISGIAAPEVLQALSVAIRGRRHTCIRMSASIMR